MKNKIEFKMLKQVLGCYFHQDFDYEYSNKEEAIIDICKGYGNEDLIIIVNDINHAIKYTENEINLGDFLYEKFHFSLTPQTPGIDLNTYTEFLEYIRDKITQHLLENGFCLNEIEEKITQ